VGEFKGELYFAADDGGGTTGLFDGNSAPNRVHFDSGVVDVGIPVGAKLRVRFDTQNAGATAGYVFGLDNVDVRLLPSGDVDSNGRIAAADIDRLCIAIRDGDRSPAFDLNFDTTLNQLDVDELVLNILATKYGDANLDRVFNSLDLVTVFQAGEYEDAVAGNSGWSDGDWNCDGDFTTSDLVHAFIRGGYDTKAVPSLPSRETVVPMRPLDIASASLFHIGFTRQKKSLKRLRFPLEDRAHPVSYDSTVKYKS
jgi:hypothetical protein